jgi:hypothetical protein
MHILSDVINSLTKWIFSTDPKVETIREKIDRVVWMLEKEGFQVVEWSDGSLFIQPMKNGNGKTVEWWSPAERR